MAWDNNTEFEAAQISTLNQEVKPHLHCFEAIAILDYIFYFQERWDRVSKCPKFLVLISCFICTGNYECM